jgi:hypothetical protein
VADIVSPAQEATVGGRKKRNPGEVMGGHSIPGPGGPVATGRIVSNALRAPASSIKALQRPGGGHASTIRERSSTSHYRNGGAAFSYAWPLTSVDPAPACRQLCDVRASGGAENAMRAQAVAATVIAPATAIACCQPSAGTAICARPRAA